MHFASGSWDTLIMIGTTDGGRSHLIQQPSIILTFEFRGLGQLYATGPCKGGLGRIPNHCEVMACGTGYNKQMPD